MRRVLLTVILPLLLIAVGCSNSEQRYVENGNRFFDKGKFKEASIMYRRALQKNARYGEGWYRLGLVSLKLEAYGDAERALRRAVELQPDNADASTKLADLYLAAYLSSSNPSKSVLKEVQDLTDTLLKRNPKSYDGLRLAGYLAFVRQDVPEAVKEFRAANAVKPGQQELVLALYQALERNSESAEAEKLGLDLISQHKNFGPIYDVLFRSYVIQRRLPDAEKILQLKATNNPKDPQVRMQLAAYYATTNRRNDMEKVISDLTANKTDFPLANFYAGDFFLRLREYDRAKQYYQQGVDENKDLKTKIEYQKRLVELLTLQGKPTEASQYVDAILKEDPKNSDGIALRASLMLQTGNREQVQMAVNDLQALVARTPDSHIPRFNYARALMVKGDFDAAAIQLQDVMKIRPDFLPGKQLWAQCASQKGDSNRALQLSEEVLQVDPRNLQMRLIRSSSLLALGEKEKAKDELKRIVADAPNSADARFQLAYLAFTEERFKDAEAGFEELRKLNPGDPRGVIGIVETKVAEKDFSTAIRMMEAELEKDPRRNDLRLALANILVRAEKFDEAIKQFQSLIAASPKSADLHLKLGETFRRKGDINAAIEEFRKASQLAPNDPNPMQLLAVLLEGTGKRAEARPLYEQILRVQPDNPVALNNLAFIKAEEGSDLDQALTLAQRARQKVPTSNDIADTLGWIYIKKNLTDDAVRIFKEIVDKEPKNPIYRYHLAMALFQKGDRPSARKEADLALKSNPSKGDEGKIKELLAKIG